MGALWPGRKADAGVCAVGCGLWKVEGWEGVEGVGVGLDGCGEWWGVECFIEGKKGGRERL